MDRSEPKSVAPSAAGPAAKAPTTGATAATNAAAPSPAALSQRPWLLRKRSSAEVMRCPDLPTLRQWIVERRIARDDEISRSGQRWRRMGSVVELESLFYSAEQERAQNRRTTGQFAPVPAQPTSGGTAPTPRLTPVPTPVATTPGSGAPGPRPTPVSTPAMGKPETRAAETVEAKKIEPAPAKKAEPTPVKKQEPVEAKKTEPTPAKKPEAATPTPAPVSEKKPPESGSGVGTVKVTPPPGLAAAAGGLSPMRLARKDPNRGKPQAMPGMAGSVQAAMRAAGTPAGKPAPAAGNDAKRPDAAAPARNAPAAGSANPKSSAAANTNKPAATGGAGSGKAGPTVSGAQTAQFARGSQEPDDAEDADITRKMMPADARSTDRQKTRPRDAVEDAILRNDPVPRHLKEAAEGGNTIRKTPKDEVDPTEFISPGPRPGSRLRVALLLLAVVVVGGGIWFVTQHNDNTTPTTTGDSTGPATTGTPTTNIGTNPTPPTPGPEVVPPTPVAEPLNTGTTKPTGPEVAPTPAKPEPAKPVVVTPEPAKPEPIKVEPVKPEPAKPVVAKVEPTKPEPAKPVVANPTATPPTATDPATAPAKPTLDDVRKKIGEDIPKGFDDQMELAQRLVERYKYDSAQALYEYMLTYASAVPAIHNGLGTCAFEKNRGDEAIQHYRNALERRPSYSAAVFGLAKTYHRLKNDKEQALVYYKKYLDLNPKGSAANIARESIAKLEGQPAPAAPAPTPAAPAAPTP